MSAAPEPFNVLRATRAQNDNAGKIRCHPSGRYVNPLAMTPDDVDIRDVAHHLSLICRYTGACPTHYSVGQHSLLCMMAAAKQPEHNTRDAALWQLAHLLHDAGEYVFNDVASPVKRDPRMAWYCEMEHGCTLMICAKYGVSRELHACTKPLDDELFRREAATWWGDAGLIHPWRPKDTEERFLHHFQRLYKETHG